MCRRVCAARWGQGCPLSPAHRRAAGRKVGAKLIIGSGTIIAPNCGFITSNHDLNDFSKSAPGKDITIGSKCWIGMNSMILPGITLGDNTIVGAGSVVTKSFPQGNCVIAGNPARKIRDLN